jgi:hypothetical protein
MSYPHISFTFIAAAIIKNSTTSQKIQDTMKYIIFLRPLCDTSPKIRFSSMIILEISYPIIRGANTNANIHAKMKEAISSMYHLSLSET